MTCCVHVWIRTQALTFARPKLRKDPGAGWSRGTQDIKLPREGWTNLKLQCFHFPIVKFVGKERTAMDSIGKCNMSVLHITIYHCLPILRAFVLSFCHSHVART